MTIELFIATFENDESRANQVLQDQDNLRRELVYQVSHDLRSPLQIVYGYADMLHQAELGPVTPLQADVLDLMLKRTRAIEQMTRDIMATKPIDRESLELAKIDLNQLCQQTMVDARMVSEERDNLDFQIALGRNRHAAYKHIKFAGNQGGDNSGPFRRYKLYFDAHVCCQFFSDIDLKAD